MIPAGLRLAHATPELVELRGRLPREGPLLVAVALAALGLVPLIAPGPLTALRVGCALALYAIAAGIGSGAVGRRQSVLIRPKSGEIIENRRRHSLADCRAFVLTATGGRTDSEPRMAYRVELELASGQHVTVLDGTDPAEVLCDLRRLLDHVALPVRGGWGMPKDAEPWRCVSSPKRPPATRALELRAESVPSQRRAAITVLCGAVFTTVAMGVMFGTRLRRGDSVSSLSWALAIGTICLLYVIGIFIVTDHVTVRAKGDSLVIERRALWRIMSSREIRRSEVLRAFAVGPSADDARHVVIETRDGLSSVACVGDAASALAGAFAD